MLGLSENHPNSLNGEIEILEKAVVEGLGKLKTTVNAMRQHLWSRFDNRSSSAMA